jgi:RelA/SpoT family protein
MIYTEPAYSLEQVDAAGKEFVTPPLWTPEYEGVVNIVNNWRTSHHFPLNTFTVTLKSYARDIEADCLVAQRIKRSESIRIKLERFGDWLTLSKMQDLGGCRAIMHSVESVDKLVARYKASRIKHPLEDEDDYIRKPKKSGYRGIHLIYRYYSDKKTTYNGLQIELQLRTVRMHAWATAVETVDTFTKQGLKTGKGKEDWKRFFVLMSSYFALAEKTQLVPKTPTDKSELVNNLRELALRLNVVPSLKAYQVALQAFMSADAPADAHYYVLSLEAAASNAPRVFIWSYGKEELKKAEAHEQTLLRDASKDVVLVAVDSLDALHKAYPNYFADTSLFIESVQEVLKD